MNKIKILHCADLHLGAELSSLGSKAGQRREEMLMTFDGIVSICRKENVELLLIAGDFFESTGPDSVVVRSVKKALSEIPETAVAIAPGNHDYVSLDSPYADQDWPENVHIFQSGFDCFELPGKGVRVWGAGFTGTYVTEPLLGESGAPEDDLLNICVLHGDLVAENQSSNYNPVTPSRIRFSGMDYLALGHIHMRTEILHSGKTAYAYCGCPEGRGFDELGEKGVYIGTVMKDRAELAFRPVCRRKNLEVRVDIGGVSANNEAAAVVLHTLQQQFGETYADNLYKIILEGALDVSYSPDCTGVAARLENELYYVKIKDETHLQADLGALSRETSLKGIFVRRMLEKINAASGEPQKEQCRRALDIGLKAFDSEVKRNEN
ncbi:metallophosphoesterase family protein [Caproiciproducens faecalis]|uniref:DNA repair exonuclease n=1 Tax=Caproiciproducens faecalis TaxID=2820301 RepID=A0ABS7DLL4_9FIRM|nr:DNA repair exonuclease [Caproiciproducens faecalis]MBW7572215.1 DNA repair exonuclease [Caproiciproducens faecalis]